MISIPRHSWPASLSNMRRIVVGKTHNLGTIPVVERTNSCDSPKESGLPGGVSQDRRRDTMAILLWLLGIPVTLALVMWLVEIVQF
jgi:hypothetical protein